MPAIIDPATHERAVAQLARNGALGRRNSRHFYLLRCLLSCGRCGRSMVRISHPGSRGPGNPHRYYNRTGQDLVCPKSQGMCSAR